MRIFIAVQLDESILDAYRKTFYERGRTLYPDLRWVAPDNLHLTMRFLGETAPERVEPLRVEVEAAVGPHAPFEFRLGKPGCFPGGGGVPRVFWLGLGEGCTALERLAKGIERAVRRSGFPGEKRPWRAHLTVARNSKRSPRRVAESEWERLGLESGLAGLRARVDNVALLESMLRPEGPLYSLVWEAHLGATETEQGWE